MAPLKHDYRYTSRQMQDLEGQPNPNLLGLYSGSKNIVVEPTIESYGLPGKYCSAVTSLNVNINIEPIIYISKEAQQYACTKLRTEQHELLHHQFEVNVASKSKPHIEQMVIKYFGSQFNITDRSQLKNLVSPRSTALLEEIQLFFSTHTSPMHAKIDNPENYKIESSYCSYQENLQIDKILKMRY
jgi:Fe-S cluster assembly iron-binding protein IscA